MREEERERSYAGVLRFNARESVELWSRPRDPFPTVLSSSSYASSRYRSPCSFSLSPPLHPAYLLSFLRGFCLRWKGNHGASRVTGPTVFFSSRGGQLPSLSSRLSLTRLVRLSLFVFFLPRTDELEVSSSLVA